MTLGADMTKTRAVECAIVRGGTSKGVFFVESDLPDDPGQRDEFLLRAFGSPDPRQIDGLGGADPLTSKCVIVGPGDGKDFDLRYTFAQVEIDRPHVDYGSVCGNLSSGLGYFGLLRGLLKETGTVSRARVHVVNNDAWLEVETPVEDGQGQVGGDFRIAGVPGSGAEVVLNLAGLAGARLGSVFPTGNRADELEVPGVGRVRVTLMDLGNPHVFLAAEDAGITGTESAADLDADAGLLDRLERIRSAAAARMGLVSSVDVATAESPAAPILGVVAAPAEYTTPSGETVSPDDVDILGRLMFMQRTHKTYAGTSTACTGIAARLAGTVAAELAGPADHAGADSAVRIGHPSGVIASDAVVADDGSGVPQVERATVSRTARILMTGQVLVPR